MEEPIFEITSYNAKTNEIRAPLHPSAEPKPVPWCWPLPRLGDQHPVAVPVSGKLTNTVDIGYSCQDFDADVFVPVFAVQCGEVSLAIGTDKGFVITIDHGEYCSHYSHLSKMHVIPGIRLTRRRELVQPGQVIGIAAKNPLHVRFALSERIYLDRYNAVDPIPHLTDWVIAPIVNSLRSPTEAA
jgi:murein DD-endopeptidase MepM/ murein hydrolase activator NlpD